MKTPSNHRASESAPSTANSTLNDSDPAASGIVVTTNSAAHTDAAQIQPNQTVTGTADLSALRLPTDYGATLGVKKLLTNVLVRRPKKSQFFRAHRSDGMTFPAMILENKEARESYLVVPAVGQQISEVTRSVMLHAAIDRQNNPFLIPVPLPGEDGARNPWHESLAQAVELAKSTWIRIAANMNVGGYDVYEAAGELPEPEWPTQDMAALIQVAFRGKIITSLEHPVVQSLLGKI